jgi:cytochrome c biogenesis protein CcmG/thiol:disulfide interchange protein DsbE
MADEVILITEVQARKRPSRRSITILVGVCILNVFLLVLLWNQLLTPAQNQSGGNSRSTSGLGDIPSPLIGKQAPDFTLPVLDGHAGSATLHLADLKGKAVVLNFWASWCGPCTDETPFLQKSWVSLQKQSILFIGIDGPEKVGDALKFLHRYGISYPIVQDTINSAIASNYGVAGFPQTIFIDREGIVVAKWASPLSKDGLQIELAKITR